jgi:tryptophan-rich sensory protein
MTVRIARLLGCVLVCQLAGFIGSLFTAPAIPVWYAALHKPSFNPPAWVFAPVWTILYLLMGISLFLIWDRGVPGGRRGRAIALFFVQLILNSLWSFFFFGLRSPLAGLAVIMLLLGMIIWTTIRFLALYRPAGMLLLPYLLWVGFAAVLNTALFLLNR